VEAKICKLLPPLTQVATMNNNRFMKKLLILTLLFTLSCNKESSSGQGTEASTETTSTETVTPKPIIPAPTPVPTTPKPTTPTTPTGPTTPTTPTAPSPTTQVWLEQFMDLINNHRQSIGLRALIHDDELGAVAQTHCQNMANGTVAFGHDGFSTRCSLGRKILGGGNWCGENVAAGQKTPQAAYTAWMNSPGHKANIEQSRATHTGFGYAKNSSGKYYWTQIFLEL
jgi:uncharacterized protein YkwD